MAQPDLAILDDVEQKNCLALTVLITSWGILIPLHLL